MTSPSLPSPITITLYGTDEQRTFSRVSDVVEWAAQEQDAWAGSAPTHHPFSQHWNTQRSHAGSIRSMAISLGALLERPESELAPHERQAITDYFHSLSQQLGGYASGQVLSTSHPQFGLIGALADTDPNAAAALAFALMPNGASLLSSAGALDAIARIGVAFTAFDEGRRKTVRSLRTELDGLRKKAEADIESWRTTIDEHSAATTANVAEHQAAVEARRKETEELFTGFREEWDTLKRTYDEKLALLAPTEYWRTRAKDHRDKARSYAIAFGLTLVALMILFGWLGIPHLKEPGTQSVALVLIPVLVPAFAGLWVLRILGRLLSENLAISQDAAERETMVKTFLSLMRDESRGKSVVTDDDRHIILQALFRPSTVTATDDTPPVHWLQAMKPGKP